MKTVSAQVSVYGLGGSDTAAAVAAFLGALQGRKLAFEMGAMSTVIWGQEAEVWGALRHGYAAAAELGPTVMQVTLSNACPLPQKGDSHGGDA